LFRRIEHIVNMYNTCIFNKIYNNWYRFMTQPIEMRMLKGVKMYKM
jgi:hypothetical protein